MVLGLFQVIRPYPSSLSLLRSIQDPWYAGAHAGWPLEARRSLFPDWPCLCTVMSHHCAEGFLHIPVQILAGKFKMDPANSWLHKFGSSCIRPFPGAQIRQYSHEIVRIFSWVAGASEGGPVVPWRSEFATWGGLVYFYSRGAQCQLRGDGRYDVYLVPAGLTSGIWVVFFLILTFLQLFVQAIDLGYR